MVKAPIGLRPERSRVQLPAILLSGNDFGQVVHTHVPLSPSSINCISHGAAMSSDWEDNNRSVVALAMRHRLVVYPPTGSTLSP